MFRTGACLAKLKNFIVCINSPLTSWNDTRAKHVLVVVENAVIFTLYFAIANDIKQSCFRLAVTSKHTSSLWRHLFAQTFNKLLFPFSRSEAISLKCFGFVCLLLLFWWQLLWMTFIGDSLRSIFIILLSRMYVVCGPEMLYCEKSCIQGVPRRVLLYESFWASAVSTMTVCRQLCRYKHFNVSRLRTTSVLTNQLQPYSSLWPTLLSFQTSRIVHTERCMSLWTVIRVI